MTPKKDIDVLLKNARFDLTEKERELFKKDFETYLDMIKVFEDFDLVNVKEARAPFEYLESDDTLRDDNIIFNNAVRVLEQASKTEDGYIVLEEDKDE
jgi:aspartyl/glutamyl-tRNA(Asn/Gln) amidotransferase C subunit